MISVISVRNQLVPLLGVWGEVEHSCGQGHGEAGEQGTGAEQQQEMHHTLQRRVPSGPSVLTGPLFLNAHSVNPLTIMLLWSSHHFGGLLLQSKWQLRLTGTRGISFFHIVLKNQCLLVMWISGFYPGRFVRAHSTLWLFSLQGDFKYCCILLWLLPSS